YCPGRVPRAPLILLIGPDPTVASMLRRLISAAPGGGIIAFCGLILKGAAHDDPVRQSSLFK
ncbi:MAG: hypothetical protein KJN62_05925, partial [Deltaproteobacteria bacterium]|nr:hypothetical protein [Deltaproteobacteria bacterium]